MSSRTTYVIIGLITILCSSWILSIPNQEEEDRDAVVKIALRESGNQLLLANTDSTSLILPVKTLGNSKYQLSFQHPLAIDPDSLVNIVKRNIKKSGLPAYYRVEVVQCSDDQVAYSYEIKNNTEKDIIPCSGRFLPEACYTIELKFTSNIASLFRGKTMLFILMLIGFFSLGYIFNKRKQSTTSNTKPKKFETLGSFQFYPEQNKLVKKALEITLSKKECELLAIFVARPNEIIKRDELTKKVWEDNGVFVGRSLDTYISKLRKILKDDDAIKLTNVHGVGYKLEVK